MKYESVQIFCPYHCGSNFLTNVIRAGYKTRILLDGSTFIHKHKINHNNDIDNFIKNNENILFITIIKDFHYWFFSLKKEPYLINFEENQKNKLLSGVTLKYPNSNDILYFKNIYELYVEYYNFYKNISKYKNVINLNHSDLIFQKNKILNILDKNLIKNMDFSDQDYDGLLNIPQKNHGNPSYGNALFQLYKKDISEIISLEEINIINKFIDK